MAAVAVQNPVDPKPAKTSSSSVTSANWIIPEVIEERRKRSDGKIVCNRYVTGKLLGKGGFAKVFIGTLLPSKQEYALKIVSKASLTKDRARLKLQSEIKIHKTLNHENICKFERCFEDNTYYYLLMELCTNQSMSTLLEQRKRITEPEMRYYLRQLVLSLQYLREHLVIHRDLKLGNIFLDEQMRIKVGDFGLAAKLTYDSERRKTICGTPNYIAPEILKSDTGHSFEVDVWSTGVIIYTLLVGKPPFQCKDIKSTYNRILRNSFSFPDQIILSTDAKNLITHMLQHYPSSRLRLHEILEHPFFTSSHNFTPASLPESSLRQCPHIEDLTPRTTAQYAKLSPAEDKRFDAYKAAPLAGDENDPNAINRATHRLQAAQAGGLQKPDGLHATENSGGVTTRSAASRMKAVVPDGVNKVVPTAFSQQLAAAATTNQRPKSAGPLQRRNFQQKFDIFVDQEAKSTATRPQTSTTASASAMASTAGGPSHYTHMAHLLPHAPTAPGATGSSSSGGSSSSSAGFLAPETTPPAKLTSLSSPGAPREEDGKRRQSHELSELKTRAYRVLKPDSVADLQQVQSGLQHVHISETTASTVLAGPPTRVREAWAVSTTTSSATMSTATTALAATSAAMPSTAMELAGDDFPASAQPAAMRVSTPPEHVLRSKDMDKLRPGTLEAVHDMLKDHTYSQQQLAAGWEAQDDGRVRSRSTHGGSAQHARHASQAKMDKVVPKIWVVRYVDYTSKYGLGFLLNNGSAGVNFNDSTKIVLSPDGKVFQYFERKRSGLGNEHSSQRYYMDNFPSELHKKVTLLRHFRNYLFEEEKNSKTEALLGHAGNRDEAEQQAALRQAFSRDAFADAKVHMEIEGIHQLRALDDDVDMPFVKKYVRTKHAILFRLSNHTVQMVFYDRSEILLSSEARYITYVNKQGVRSDHYLEDSMLAERSDIAQRLKYTKDIMYRLIIMQDPKSSKPSEC